MRERPYVVLSFGLVLAYLAVLLLVAAFVVGPSTLGWVGLGIVSAIGLAIGATASVLYPRSRSNAPRLHPRPGAPVRLLVVADAHCSGTALCRAVQQTLAGRPAEVFVLAPVLASPLHFLTDAEEAEREDARVRLTEALQGLARAGIQARGALGSDDPLQAIGDTLVDFHAGEILRVAPEQRRRSWLERDLARRARDSYGLHVSTVRLGSAAAAAASTARRR